MNDDVERVSRISKKISRIYFNKSIRIPKYESVNVEVAFEEDVTWKTLDERAQKSVNITLLLEQDFNKTVSELFRNLKIADKDNVVYEDIEQEIEDKKKDGLKTMGLDGLTGE